MHKFIKRSATVGLSALLMLVIPIVMQSPAHARPAFQMPFPCGQTWHASTYTGHRAIDWNQYPEDNGKQVVASAGGIASSSAVSGYGYQVVIDHGGGWQTRYAHLQQNGRVSGPVTQGQRIGYIGSSGSSTAPHLHWEQIQNGTAQMPLYANGQMLQPGTVPNQSAPQYTSANCPAPSIPGAGGGLEVTSNGQGYIMTSAKGQVYAYGNAAYHGGSPAHTGNIVDSAYRPGTNQYWLVSSAGEVYSYGAPYHGGSPTGYAGSIIAIEATPSGNGYWLVTSKGQVYAYGDAQYKGALSGFPGTIIDIASTPSGNGYWLVSTLGEVYAYGDASYHGGSPQGFAGSITDFNVMPNGGGYMMVTTRGQVYAYGNAQHHGNATSFTGNIVDAELTPNGGGYWLLSTAGEVYSFGNAQYHGGSPTGMSGSF